MALWPSGLGTGLQNLVRGFDSRRRLFLLNPSGLFRPTGNTAFLMMINPRFLRSTVGITCGFYDPRG